MLTFKSEINLLDGKVLARQLSKSTAMQNSTAIKAVLKTISST